MGATRTNIAIDDELMRKALAATGLRPRRRWWRNGLKLVRAARAQGSILGAERYSAELGGQLDEMRRDRLRTGE